MLPDVGVGELIVIMGIVLLLFGPKKLPELARGLGRSIKAFKEGMRDVVPEETEAEKKEG